MLKNFFKKQNKESSNNKNILVAALLIHAAKIDENYTEIEKKIIKKAIIDLNEISPDEAEKILEFAEKKEKESNQIIEFTREVKKYSMEFRLKIIEIIIQREVLIFKVIFSAKRRKRFLLFRTLNSSSIVTSVIGKASL